jgi:putative oxidoreductase
MTPVRTVARALLAAVFIRSGVQAFTNPDKLADRAQPFTDKWAPTLDSVGLPTDARTLVKLNGAVQAGGGVLLATNTLTRPAALALAGSLIPTTVAGHDFWSQDEPAQKASHQTQFFKNLGLLGGLLLAAVDTEGKPGLAWRAGHLADHAQGSVKRAAYTTAKETRRAARTTAKEAARAAQSTTREAKRATAAAIRETGRAAHTTAREAKRTALDAQRSAKHMKRTAKVAVKSAKANRLLPS